MTIKFKHSKYIIYCVLCLNISACSEEKSASTYIIQKEFVAQKPTWKKPYLWKKSPITHISQIASFNINDAKISLSILKGDGGGVVSNINRWRAQLGIPKHSNQQIQDEVRNIGNWVLIKLHDKNKQKAIFAAINKGSDNTIFAKISGNTNDVNEQAETFLQFLTSIKIDTQV